jgi:hypothetical protein
MLQIKMDTAILILKFFVLALNVAKVFFYMKDAKQTEPSDIFWLCSFILLCCSWLIF